MHLNTGTNKVENFISTYTPNVEYRSTQPQAGGPLVNQLINLVKRFELAKRQPINFGRRTGVENTGWQRLGNSDRAN